MATLQTVTNTDNPFLNIDGSAQKNKELKIIALGSDGEPVRFMAHDGGSTAGAISVFSDSSGIFSIDLVSNTGSNENTKYRFVVMDERPTSFDAYVFVRESGPVLWKDLRIGSTPVPADLLQLFLEHMGDTDATYKHLPGSPLEGKTVVIRSSIPVWGLPDTLPTFVYTQVSASMVWNIPHNLGFKPSVELINSGGAEFDGEVTHTDLNNTVVQLTVPRSGTARCL